MKHLFTFFAMAFLCGCAAGPQSGKPPATQPVSAQPTEYQISLTAHPLEPQDPKDPRPQLQALVHLDVYQFDLPMGTVSRNDEFWKRVDEQCLTVGTADILYKNGLRCGVASKISWLFFRDVFAASTDSVRKSTINGSHAPAVELELTKKIDAEDLFFFDSRNRLEGRSYEQCVNLVNLSFEPSPTKPGAVRIAILPAIRGERKKLEFTSLNQDYESPFADLDRLYDLNLIVDVPDNSFLVVAPSEDAKRTTSIGGRFFVKDNQTERLEQVLVIVPTFLRLDGKPIR